MCSFVQLRNRLLFWGIVCVIAIGKAAGGNADGEIKLPVAARSHLEYLPRVWETDEGLPYNRVQAIAQTADGYLWVGTYKGLARFDGLQFTSINNPDIPALKNASITALCATADGALWIGTERRALVRWLHGQFSVFRPDNQPEVERSVDAIYQGPSGVIWITSAYGLDQIRGNDCRSYTVKQGLLSDDVTAICEDNETNVWIGTGKGLNRLRAGKMESFANLNGFTNNPVRSICQDREGRVWIGSDHGLISYQSGRFHAYTTSDGLTDNLVSAVFEDSQSNLWVGTYSGLTRFSDGRFYPELSASGMPYDKINTIMEDLWGDIWAGSREGLIRLTARPFSVYTTRQGLSHNYTKSVLEDHLGRLWVGTWGGGLDQITGDKVRVYAASNHFASDLILALCEDRDGGIWVGSDNQGGLSHINDQQVRHYTSRNGLPNASVTALHQDRAEELWVGTTVGLGRWKDEHFIKEPQCGSMRIWAICDDGEGGLWIGSDTGLTHRHGETYETLKTTGIFPRRAIALLADTDGKTLWVGTPDYGLLRWKDNQFDRYDVQDGLFSDEILGIEEEQGWLWMTSTKGIFRVRKNDLESPGTVIPCIAYGKADGLESIVCGGTATPSLWKTKDGRLCFATTKGLAVIDGRNIRLELSPPLVRVERFYIDRKETPLPVSGELILPPNHGELEFRYSALDLRAPEKCRFKYKLDGVNPDWIDAGTRRVALYNNVAPGSYSFHVTACNKDGVWNKEGTTIPLRLRPHLWQTWWFQMLCAGTVLGGVGGLARIVTHRRLKRRLELMRQQQAVERERTRIAKDIHDELGSSLTRIMFLGRTTRQDLAEHKEIEPHLRKIETSCDAILQTMDEIVWAVNPENDNLDGLIDYLSEYAGEFFEGTSVRCQFELPVTPPSFVLPAEVRHDLFLAVKEALNNILKHSGATQGLVQVSMQDETVQIVIADNGHGFDASRPAGGGKGNGLVNIGHRLEKHGGRFELSSEAGKGTRLSLFLRVKQRKASPTAPYIHRGC
jgi:ligand-binding sensor domain-containing protein/signal transduction histidine kinase